MIGDNGRFKSYKKLSVLVYKVPKSVQQTIPIYAIAQNGIFQIEPTPSGTEKTACFDKCYRFSDVNYTDKDEPEQRSFIERFCSFLNYMNASFKEVIINRNINEEVFKEETQYQPKPGYEQLVDDYNTLNLRRLKNARGIRQEKYLIVTCQTQDFESAFIQFSSLEAAIKNHFRSLDSTLTPLSTIERLQLLHDLYNVGKEKEFHLTEEDLAGKHDWKNDVICTYMKEQKGHIEFEDHFATTLFAKAYPASLDDDFLVSLTSMPYHLTVTLDCSPIPNGVTEKMLNDCLNRIELTIQRQQEYRNRHNAFSSDITYDVQRKKEEIIADLDELHDNNAKMFYVGFTVMVTTETKPDLDQAVKRIIALGDEKGLVFKTYAGRQIQAMNTTLPVGYRGVKNMRSLFTQCTAALMPFHVQELTEPDGIVYGVNQTSGQLIRGNRKLLTNGNGFIFGSTGYGKSVNAKMEMGQVLVSTDDDLIVIDPQNEYFDICRQWGGQVVNLSERSRDYMNPLDIPDHKHVGNISDFIAEKVGFAMGICIRALDPMPFKPIYRSLVGRCIKNIYEDIFQNHKKESPTFVTFRDELLKQPEEEAKELAGVLEIFVDGSLSLFSHQSNVDIDNRFICYGINDLGQGLRALALLVMIENVSNRITSNARIGKATWVYVDECHTILDDEYGLSTFEKLWKEVRKKGGLMTGITQNVIDCLVNKRTRTIISNSEYISMLSQSEFEQDTFDDILKMSDAQMKLITNAPRGTGIMKFGEKLLAFDNTVPKNSNLYRMFNTNLHEKAAMGHYESGVNRDGNSPEEVNYNNPDN